jgi:hypothetical protein
MTAYYQGRTEYNSYYTMAQSWLAKSIIVASFCARNSFFHKRGSLAKSLDTHRGTLL